jgi:hypothetical protein
MSEETTESTESTESTEFFNDTATTETTESTESEREPVGIEAELAAASAQSSESEDSAETTGNESGGDGSDSKGQPEGAPEEYADFQLPEGYSWSDEAKSHFEGMMKEYGASQENAQALLDMHGEMTAKFLQSDLEAQQKEAYTERANEWAEQAKQDPRLAGDNGELWDASLAQVNAFLDAVDKQFGKGIGDESVKDTLIKLGALQHPNVMLVLRKAGESMFPDALTPSGDGGGASKDWDDMSLAEKRGYGKDGLAPSERGMLGTTGNMGDE